MSLCAIQQIPVDHNYRASSLETIREMVRANSGITLMPDIATRSDDPGIVYRSIEPPVPSRRIQLVRRKTSVIQPVIDAISSIVTNTKVDQADIG